MPRPSKYDQLISLVFFNNYVAGDTEIEFTRELLVSLAVNLDMRDSLNPGDVVYTYRYRKDLPSDIRAVVAPGCMWIILGIGDARYKFKQVPIVRITADPALLAIKVPDATPEIIGAYKLNDEQALLALVRYNRLIDLFLGMNAYSLQNHLRTKVENIGQIEIDEIYVGVDRHGRQYIVPVQAKRGSDRHGIVQTLQDHEYCVTSFPGLIHRLVSAQFMSSNRIAMFELTVIDGEVRVVEQKHYQLVPASSITAEDLSLYAHHAP